MCAVKEGCTQYDVSNARGAQVWDVERMEHFDHVISVRPDVSEIEVLFWPARIAADGQTIDTYKVRFTTIYPIRGEGAYVQLFHCYGRIA